MLLRPIRDQPPLLKQKMISSKGHTCSLKRVSVFVGGHSLQAGDFFHWRILHRKYTNTSLEMHHCLTNDAYIYLLSKSFCHGFVQPESKWSPLVTLHQYLFYRDPIKEIKLAHVITIYSWPFFSLYSILFSLNFPDTIYFLKFWIPRKALLVVSITCVININARNYPHIIKELSLCCC